MKARRYETLDAYLDDLDAIKEKVAEETEGMTPKQFKAYFARAARKLAITQGGAGATQGGAGTALGGALG